MTTNTLAAIRERADKRTRGAWFAHEPHDSRDIEIICDTSPMGSDMEAEFESIGFVYEAEDGEFIAHAPTDIDALLAIVDELTRKLEAAEAALREIAADDGVDDDGVFDEWSQAFAFDRVQKIAADALAAHADNGESAGNGGA